MSIRLSPAAWGKLWRGQENVVHMSYKSSLLIHSFIHSFQYDVLDTHLPSRLAWGVLRYFFGRLFFLRLFRLRWRPADQFLEHNEENEIGIYNCLATLATFAKNRTPLNRIAPTPCDLALYSVVPHRCRYSKNFAFAITLRLLYTDCIWFA